MPFVIVWEILLNKSYQQTQTCRKTDNDQPSLKNLFEISLKFLTIRGFWSISFDPINVLFINFDSRAKAFNPLN